MLRMPVDVSAGALINSCSRLRSGADQLTGPASHLLRYYAVECGLKAALLRQRNLRSTAQLDTDLRSHDLRRLAAELRLDAATYRQLRRCRQSGGAGARSVEPGEMHEAWRYGASVHTGDEQAFVAGLTSLERWCRGELGR